MIFDQRSKNATTLLLLALCLPLKISADNEWQRKLLWDTPIPFGITASYKLSDLSKSSQKNLSRLLILRGGATCDEDTYQELEEDLLVVGHWQSIINTDLEAGVTKWSNANDDPNKSKAEEYVEAINSLSLTLDSETISRCAEANGFGFGSVGIDKGTEKWVSKRIQEYEEYLPKVACNSEVHSWMTANYLLATDLLPLIQEGRANRIGKWYEWSTYTNTNYLLHKKLSDSHNHTYKRQGKVMRNAAKQCEQES